MVTDVACSFCLARLEERCHSSSGRPLGRVHRERTRNYLNHLAAAGVTRGPLEDGPPEAPADPSLPAGS